MIHVPISACCLVVCTGDGRACAFPIIVESYRWHSITVLRPMAVAIMLLSRSAISAVNFSDSWLNVLNPQ